MTRHYARFVRSNSLGRIGTVAHFHGWADPPVKVGDVLVAIPKGHHRRGLTCRVTDVGEVRLLEILTDEELTKLDCDIDTYFESWDSIHPEALAKTNPLVLRVEFESTGEVEDLPVSAETQIISLVTRVAYDAIVAQENAILFAKLDKIAEEGFG